MILLTRLRALVVATIVAIALLAVGGQIGGDGWYAAHGAYRAQTSALLAGKLALSDAPEAVQHDMVWTGKDVQQVWGLGVPAWQAPFELAGRAVGWTPFPDRVALLAWLGLALYVSLRAWKRDREPAWISAGCVFITALLPAFVTLLRGRLGVYEEAAAYAFGGAIILLAGCARLARSPSRWRYFALVAAAGLAGFLRPTAAVYGLATFVVASGLHRRARDIAIGATLFVAGGAALYATNAHRFGDGFEFGHRINLQALPGNLYSTRFSYPFERVGLVAAGEELGGALFDRPERHVHTTFYGKHLHVGQSELPRWREYYFSTYNWVYPPLLLAGIVLGVIAWRRRDGPSGTADARWLVCWAVIAAAPLLWFYARAPFFSSRYALDFAPAFAALIVVAWRALAARTKGVVAGGLLACAWVASVVLARTAPRIVPTSANRIDAANATNAIRLATAQPHPLPAAYDLDDPYLPVYTDVLESFDRCTNATGTPIDPDDVPVPGDTCLHGERVPDEEQWILWHTRVADDSEIPDAGDETCELPEPLCPAAPTVATASELVAIDIPRPCLYLNMFRWDLATGQVPPATYAWIQDPEFIELDVSTLDGQPADWAHDVQVAIGRTHLPLVALASVPGATRLRFEAPHLPAGLQIAFFAFGPDVELDHATTRFLVHRVAWR
jgi:hypothetical protein